MRRIIFITLSIVIVLALHATQGGNLAVLYNPGCFLMQLTVILCALLTKHSPLEIFRAITSGEDKIGSIKTLGLQATWIAAMLGTVLGILMTMGALLEGKEKLGHLVAMSLVSAVYGALFSLIFLTIKTDSEKKTDSATVLAHSTSGTASVLIMLMLVFWMLG